MANNDILVSYQSATLMVI